MMLIQGVEGGRWSLLPSGFPCCGLLLLDVETVSVQQKVSVHCVGVCVCDPFSPIES